MCAVLYIGLQCAAPIIIIAMLHTCKCVCVCSWIGMIVHAPVLGGSSNVGLSVQMTAGLTDLKPHWVQ